MRGMNRSTGLALQGNDHIAQSVRDILETRIGSRVMLRAYGSRVPETVDRPMNTLFDVEVHAAVGEALDRWEPRFKLTRVEITSRTAEGRVVIATEGIIVSDGTAVRLEGIKP